MTYEASRKKQTLVLQPKGKPLYEEDNSFGLKMLQSMGWQKGNGLGKNQQGNLDFIKVRYRNNASGLGFDNLKDNQWTENESNFDSLLKNLNSNSNSNSADEESAKKATKSLEEMSKKSRARVHYKKFTRGKDVFKYSEKDLANILGKKTLKEEEPKAEEVSAINDSEKPGTYESDLIVNTGISISEYFYKKKMSKSETKSGEESEGCEKFPLKRKESVSEECEEPVLKKKKKHKKHKQEQIELEESDVKDKCKKKKSKKSQESCAGNDIEINEKKKKKIKHTEGVECNEKEVTSVEESQNTKTLEANLTKSDTPKGFNTIYSTNIVQIPSHVAQRMSNMSIDHFKNSNLGNVVGYGMTEDIEIKVVQTKAGENLYSTDKYSIYNVDRQPRTRVNPRKILTKIKHTKKSIQVI